MTEDEKVDVAEAVGMMRVTASILRPEWPNVADMLIEKAESLWEIYLEPVGPARDTES